MTVKVAVGIAFCALTVLSGCGGERALSPVSPSILPIQAAPALTVPEIRPHWLPGYTLTAVSLYGRVYEETPVGPVGIAGAAVYCEDCGAITHTWAIADDSGFYRFPSDISTGGGVWLNPARRTEVSVRSNANYRDPDDVPVARLGAGWREVTISGDTQFDIRLVRR